MRNIYVIRPTGFNIGNHVIFAGLRKLVSQSVDERFNFISIPASGKYDNFGKPGLTTSSVHEINQYGAAVIVGGGNLFENGEIDLDIQALKSLRVPMMILGVSWGRIFDSTGQLVERTDSLETQKLRQLLESAAFVSVRENTTLDYVRRFRTDARADGCPSLFIDDKSFYSELNTSNNVVIPIRNPNLMNIMPKFQNNVTNEIKEIINIIKFLGFTPMLLCHDHRDISFASSFTDVPYLYEESVPGFLKIISNAKAVISYRLHATLPSMLFGVPTINISYDERATALMEFLGAERLNLSLFERNHVLEIKAKLENIDNIQSELVPIAKRIDVLKLRQVDIMKQFFSSLNG